MLDLMGLHAGREPNDAEPADQWLVQAEGCGEGCDNKRHLDPLAGGVDVGEQSAGPAQVFALPQREPGGCGDPPQSAQVAAEGNSGCEVIRRSL